MSDYTWRAGPHGPLEQLDDGLFTVAGEIHMPLGAFPRRMTVVALPNGGVAIWSAICLREPEMAQIEAMGDMRFLIVPGAAHRTDIAAWKARYRPAKVICGPGASQKVAEKVNVDGPGALIHDPMIHVHAVPGTGEKELAMMVTRPGGKTLVLNDVLANVRHPKGIGAQVMARLMGFGVHHPALPWPVRRMFVTDAKALADAFLKWAADPDLRRIIVSHGDVIGHDCAAALRRVAADLR